MKLTFTFSTVKYEHITYTIGKLQHNKNVMYRFIRTVLPYVVETTRKILKNKNSNAV